MTATFTNGKMRHGSIRMVRLSAIHEAPENETLYRPVLETDPDVVALAESIRAHGLREPIVITTDNYILSGHRRATACRIVGLKEVPCRVEAVSRGDPEFLPLLREYNRQRVKSFDEVVREEIVSANAEESYQALIKHRQRQASVQVEAIEIMGEKRRAKITAAKKPFLDAIGKILDERRKFWPLTDRQIHYALLNAPPLTHASKPNSVYRNDQKSYKSLCELLTRARLELLIPFEAIDDPTRPVTLWNVHNSVGSFVRQEIDGFLKKYWRNLLQSQPNHIEIVGEKNTIANIIHPVAADYCIPMTLGRGYCSLPPRVAMANRFAESGKENLVVLVLSDFDPEGEDIVHSFARSMRDDFYIEEIEPIKVALTGRQVQDMRLPPVMKAKEGGSRYEGFVERHGDDVFELEAILPDELQSILRRVIDKVLDVGAFNREISAEKDDSRRLAVLRRNVKEMMLSLKLDEE